MKRTDLLRELAAIAKANGLSLELELEGGNHTIYRIGTETIPVGRHKEIPEPTARAILKAAREAKAKPDPGPEEEQ